jgi:hypothetical protein
LAQALAEEVAEAEEAEEPEEVEEAVYLEEEEEEEEEEEKSVESVYSEPKRETEPGTGWKLQKEARINKEESMNRQQHPTLMLGCPCSRVRSMPKIKLKPRLQPRVPSRNPRLELHSHYSVIHT